MEPRAAVHGSHPSSDCRALAVVKEGSLPECVRRTGQYYTWRFLWSLLDGSFWGTVKGHVPLLRAYVVLFWF